jgi:nitroreductase
VSSSQEKLSCVERAVDGIVRGRYAARAFTDRLVPKKTIFDILDAARHAPSGANIQPWRVYVVAGAAQRRLSAAMAQAHLEARDAHASEYRYYSSVLPEPYHSRRAEFGRIFYGSLGIAQSDTEGRSRQTAKNYDFFGAPVGLIVTIDRRLERGSWLDLGMFLQNILISAGARGLQSCPQETFSKYHAILREHLPISHEEMVVCGISIGYARDGDGPMPRLMPKAPVDAFATFVGFDHETITGEKR